MAIDTENKRRSVSAYFGAITYPVADASIDASDREHVAGLYAGIASTPPVIVIGRGQTLWVGIGIRP